ncbi:DNA-binding protein [Bifidobacterium primatium]|uniref:DNA-binding protein n=2 Tax=Bifidobacterium primatium TaxID=2045438 RepID=A0A2M9HB84_9BIFI|nr:DNA-binding protein [Bifidobacterium primatium]
MATITIRKVDDGRIALLKREAEENNRSMESQARSIIEDHLAAYVAKRTMNAADFVAEMRELLDGEYIEGDEFDVRDRQDYGRPLPFEGAS